MRSTTLALALASTLTLTACGGGGIFEPPVEAEMPVVPAFTGYIYNSGGGGVNQTSIRVGDNNADGGRRGFVRFDLSSIPVGANIVSAQLDLTQTAVTGAPYGGANLGSISLRHANLGGSLTVADYSGPLLSIFTKLFSSTAGLGLRSADVTDWVLTDLNDGRTTIDVRLQFSSTTDADGSTDTAEFEDSAAAVEAPRLVVRYNLP